MLRVTKLLGITSAIQENYAAQFAARWSILPVSRADISVTAVCITLNHIDNGILFSREPFVIVSFFS